MKESLISIVFLLWSDKIVYETTLLPNSLKPHGRPSDLLGVSSTIFDALNDFIRLETLFSCSDDSICSKKRIFSLYFYLFLPCLTYELNNFIDLKVFDLLLFNLLILPSRLSKNLWLTSAIIVYFILIIITLTDTKWLLSSRTKSFPNEKPRSRNLQTLIAFRSNHPARKVSRLIGSNRIIWNLFRVVSCRGGDWKNCI